MKIKIQKLNMKYMKHFISKKHLAKIVNNIWSFTIEAYSLMKETDVYINKNNI